MREEWAHTTEAEHITADVKRGNTRAALFGGTHTVIPTLDEVRDTIMPSHCEVDDDTDNDYDADEDRDNPTNPADLDIDRTCLQEAIKQVGDMRTVTGIAAGVWGQLLTAEPAIVDQIIQEQISNSMPAAVRDLLTGVHYRVLGYDDSAKRRPVGSLDAIVKVAQVYLLKAEQASIAEVSGKMLDHAVGTPNGMAKIVSTLKARVMQAIEQADERLRC